MPTNRLAIVSSYSESCGIASFAKFIKNSINYHFPEIEVDIIELDLRLLQSTNSKFRKKADKHILNICKKLQEYNAVNIQVEPGLYGRRPDDIVERIGTLLKAHPFTSVTQHTPQLIGSEARNASLANVLKAGVRGKLSEAMIEFKRFMTPTDHIQVNHAIARKAYINNTRIIVHTQRAKKQLESFYNYTNVDVHPLKLVPDSFEPDHSIITYYRSNLKLSDKDVIIGMFGFISSYKGHSLALESLRLLPPEYKLFIFGKQHPGTIKLNEATNEYIKELIEKIEKDPLLRKRVFFLGELDDQKFISAASDVDIAWLPYLETGQDGSGIASIVFDANPKVLCSASLVFDELFRLVPYKNVERFDIGNELELAQKTQMLFNASKPQMPYALTDEYTVRTQALVYLRDLNAPQLSGQQGLISLIGKKVERKIVELTI